MARLLPSPSAAVKPKNAGFLKNCLYFSGFKCFPIIKKKMKAEGDDPLDFHLSKGKRYKWSGNTFHQRFMDIDAISALCGPAH